MYLHKTRAHPSYTVDFTLVCTQDVSAVFYEPPYHITPMDLSLCVGRAHKSSSEVCFSLQLSYNPELFAAVSIMELLEQVVCVLTRVLPAQKPEPSSPTEQEIQVKHSHLRMHKHTYTYTRIYIYFYTHAPIYTFIYIYICIQHTVYKIHCSSLRYMYLLVFSPDHHECGFIGYFSHHREGACPVASP